MQRRAESSDLAEVANGAIASSWKVDQWIDELSRARRGGEGEKQEGVAYI
jgi:hypothetical protein